PLLPAPPPAMPQDPRAQAEAAWRALLAAWRAHGETFRTALAPLFGNGLNRSQYKPEHAAAVFEWLARQPETPPADTLHDKLVKYGARALAKGCNKGVSAPSSPLCEAIDALLDARDALDAWRTADDLRRLHALRERARALDAARKEAFNVRAYDDLVAAVHAALQDDATRAALAQALRRQFALALVDEFQDTDTRQWTLFDALFADALVLVGDPKQAIYRFRGGDIATYLRARASVDDTEVLTRNFRSRPGVIDAVNALFGATPDPQALGEGIRFEAAEPGGRVADDALRLDGAAAPALCFHAVPPPGDGNERGAEESRRIAARLCAQAVVEQLQAGADGRLQLRDGAGFRAVEPRDCAVLVRSHREAAAVRQALAAAGVPAAAAGRGSLYQTDEALDLLALLLAVRAPGDERRVRAALASPLFCFDAASLAALDADGDALRRWQQRFEAWRARWERHGPQAMLTDVLAERAQALRTLTDGERRLANWLQLGELLQETRTQRLGLQGQIDALRAAIDNADPEDEAQMPRLESDAACVQILTLHASKGLEFPLVFLPFLGIGQKNGQVRGEFALYTEGERRVRYWKRGGDWKTACQRHLAEERAETMRLLYVGLTRARHALWLCGGAFASAERSPLAALMGDTRPPPALRERLADALVLREGEPAAETPVLRPGAPPAPPPPRTPLRALRRDWWIHSFSQLHRQLPHGALAAADEAPALDERVLQPPEPVAGPAPVFAGERFGNALHHALERIDFAAWRGSDGRVPDGQAPLLLDALRSQQYPPAAFADGVAALAPLVARTVNAPLPLRDGSARALCDVPAHERIAEMEFHFALGGSDTRALLALLHAHGIAAHRQDFGGWNRLAGLMTGKIDLVCRIDGALYVLDYKSNRLPGYDAAQLAQAMRASEYDLQALLYTLAVHRWLHARRGDAYDYERDVGGVRYLFCRGLDPADPARGVHALRFPRALVEAADALLAAGDGA
ncbi:MAG TPA: UvrD-helicase domain-containing protein, partial [Lysobacter sp.]|nr:UvrD-helicase domain-containing protein [Lysobacter sp.]